MQIDNVMRPARASYFEASTMIELAALFEIEMPTQQRPGASRRGSTLDRSPDPDPGATQHKPGTPHWQSVIS